ncbi:MAG: putative Type I phosphodiesterase/nucleotide pyrophosphatase/phosphate transferase [Promethearchaeota archaeon]|nr:MAG: putative Type I phosphodiesterase/nucleotide pyrophosphatase/phosphate transferase [Candidatus Lokiarchaeota archaeon]
MSKKPKKILVIGVDQAIPYLIDKFVDEGAIPTIKKLIDGGVRGEAYSCPPCDTPTNWTTLATGATTALHGATSFYMHIPGEPLEQGLKTRSRSSLSKYCGVEYFWNAADTQGLKCFILNYPGGWPGTLKNGAISLLTWPLPESIPLELTLKTKLIYRKSNPNELLSIKPLENTKNPLKEIKYFSPPLKISIQLKHEKFKEFPPLKAYLLDTKNSGYDALAIRTGEKNQWEIIKHGNWSDWISNTITTKEYGVLPCVFKVNIKQIKSDGSSLHLQFTSIYNTKGWTNPVELGEKIIRNALIFDLTREQQKVDYMISGAVKSFLGNARNEALNIANIIKYMKAYMHWDICFFHIHTLDSVNHRTLGKVYKKSPLYKEKKAEKTWEHIRVAYQIVDELVANLMDSVVDEETIVVFVSDHGAIPTWRVVNPLSALINAGLLVYQTPDAEGNCAVDWSKTKAFPYIEPPYVWVNRKGRDPEGIVEQSEYESIRDQVIEALYQLKDPDTGEQIIELAVKKEDADHLGQMGERIGDVIYFIKPPYQLFDYRLEQLDPSIQPIDLLEMPAAYDAQVNCAAHAYFLPNAMLGKFSNSVPLIIYGPGIKKGLSMKEVANLIDVVPTLAYLLDIPKLQSFQGKILHEILE